MAPVLGYSFVLPASPVPRYVWLQIRTTSAHQLQFQAMPADELSTAEGRAIVWASLSSAAQLLVLLALIGAWLVQRDKVLGVYLLRHSVYLVYGVGYLGLPLFLLNGLAPSSSFHTILSLSITVLLPMGLWFDIPLL